MVRGNGVFGRLQARREAAAERRSARVVAEELDRQERLRERITQQLAHQWESVREARRHEQPPVITAGPSNFARAQVPWAVDLAAAWAWRVAIIAGAALGLLWLAKYFAVVVLPLIVALFIAALAAPAVELAVRARIPRKLASLSVVVIGLSTVSLLLSFVGTQVASGMDDLSQQVVAGLEEIRTWLRDGPLNASDSQINDWIKSVQDYLRDSSGEWVQRATEFGVALGHVVAGLFIVLLATYFFLADGALIWAWVVRLFPRAARLQTDASGRVAWRSLTQFVRATVLIAAVDALGILIAALILRVPLAGAIAVLVFLFAFVPMIGAVLSGSVAVLVALVAHGPWVALIMMAAVVLVQQIEGHVLQPFLMGRFVAIHPLGVIIAIAAGLVVAGIAGALIAVPLFAALNSVVQHLAGYTGVGEPASGEEPPADDGLGDDAPMADLQDKG